jgi:hypothetical protein
METQAAFTFRFTLCEFVEQNADFAYRILQVIVHGHNGSIASSTDVAQKPIMLAISRTLIVSQPQYMRWPPVAHEEPSMTYLYCHYLQYIIS